jgi:hypothetical protein
MMCECGFADDIDGFREKEEDPITRGELSAGYFDEGLDGTLYSFGCGQTFSDVRKGTVSGKVDSPISGSGKVYGVSFEYGYGPMELPEPADIAVLDDLSKCDIDLVKRCLEAFDGRSLRIAKVFVFGYGKKEIDDIFRILTRIIDFEYAKQCSERSARNIIAFMAENLYEMFGIASARRLDLGYDADIFPKIVRWFLSFLSFIAPSVQYSTKYGLYLGLKKVFFVDFSSNSAVYFRDSVP